jgi:Na+-translocating ferredoxin:NAD+ oxidoreductase subunit C
MIGGIFMLSGVKLVKNKSISIKSKILEYKKVPYVYIPLVNHTNFNLKCLVNTGDVVYKGSAIAIRDDQFKLPIFSSVSGKVIAIEEHLYQNGQMVNCVVIENDYKEKVKNKKVAKKNINNYNKEEFINILTECGIVGMGGAGFPTYVKYNTNNKINTLLINGVECEPYITTDYVLIREYTEELLDTIDAIMEIMNIEECVIAIKEGQSELVEVLERYIGMYPSIRIVEVSDMYPMGWEKYLIKAVLNICYNKLPMEKGIIVNNIATIYSIYEALKYEKPVIEKLITVTGEGIKKPQNILVKIGTKASDIIDFVGGLTKDKELKLIAGGPMMGKAVASDDLVVNGNLNCLIVTNNLEKNIAINCFRCGKCVKLCPAKLSPVLIKDNLSNIKMLKDLEPNRCVECGLCSYICPSKIDVREYVKKAKIIK